MMTKEWVSPEHGATHIPVPPPGYAVTFAYNRDGTLGARATHPSGTALRIACLDDPRWEPAS